MHCYCNHDKFDTLISAHHTFSKLLQLRTDHGVLEKYSQTRGIKEKTHNCECSQLETVEHVLKECFLHSAKRDLLSKVSPELDPKKNLGIKKCLGAAVKFLDSLLQLLCCRRSELTTRADTATLTTS